MPHTLEATVDISASPERVWAVVSDLNRIPEFSPFTKKVLPLGTPGVGTWLINLNKAKAYTYPTTSRIVRYEPNRTFAFRMNENRTVWSYTLEPTETGTRLIQRRDVPNGVSWPVRKMIDLALGGEQQFEDDLVQGMNATLAKMKTAAEG